MSTEVTGAQSATGESAEPAARQPYSPDQYTYVGVGSAPPAPQSPSFWRRPVGIVVIVLGVVAVGMFAFVASVLIGVFSAFKPLDLVMEKDFAVDRPMVIEEGLSWDQSGGTLNMYPTNGEAQFLRFALPDTSDAAGVSATLIQPAYADESVQMMWGVLLLNGDTGDGVGLLCATGESAMLVDAQTGQLLPGAASDFPCAETATMNLEVNGSIVMYGVGEPTGNSLYSGNDVYGNFDSVAVVVASDQPDQVLKVDKIATYQP